VERENRKLAAIVAADIAGYSRLIGQDEEGTLRALRAHRKELIDQLIDERGGRIANTAGDSLLLEFPSAVNAVRCALSFQIGMSERNRNVETDRQIRFRIGINVGDVIAEGGDLLGDGVNVAARLQEIAEPGGICISRRVHEDVQDRLGTAFEDLGEKSLKNIARPVHVWRWRADGSPVSAAATVAADAPLILPDKPSIAVLPFDNKSGDPEQEIFSDGISEDIITGLSRFRSLFVTARNSTFCYKGAAPDITEVGAALGVRYVLEGSVRKAGNRIRITAQLIDALTGNHVWADRYDRELADVFALQDEITETIVGRIDTEVRASEMDRARRKPPANLDAWELYQRGLWYLNRTTKKDSEEARNFFLKAIERDPNFAAAHAGIAYTCYLEVFHRFGDNPAEWLAQGLAAGEQAVVLDDMDGFTHFALGRVLGLAGQGDRAIAELEKSVVLNPSLALAHHSLGQALNWYGRAADALPEVDMAMRLSPHDRMLWGMQAARASCCYNLGNYDEAVEWARKAVNSRPDRFWTHIHLAVALVGQGRLDEARVAIEEARRVKSDLSLSVIGQILTHYHPKYLERLISALRKAGLPE